MRRKLLTPRKNYLQKSLILFSLLAVSTSVSPGFAEEITDTSPVREFTLENITVEAKRPIWEEKLSPGTVTVIRPDDYKGEQKTLPDLLKMVPGVHVREVNGKGQYSTVTVRGSTAAQVGIFIDGVLANLGGDSAVDISVIPVKNVDRVEVYRGYIPSRFGGTFIGGVINIVTKKPETSNVSLEITKGSYGGKKGALEITSPVGDGSLMFALNHESSDGNFKYKNYAGQRRIPSIEAQLNGYNENIANFNNNNIGILYKSDMVKMDKNQMEAFKNDNDLWLAYVRGTGSDSLSGAIADNRYEYTAKRTTSFDYADVLEERGLKDQYIEYGFDEDTWQMAAYDEWIGEDNYGILSNDLKNEFIKEYADKNYQKNIDTWTTKFDPEKSESIKGYQEQIEKLNKQKEEAKNNTRYRKYNDYSNNNAIIKWQNENWVVKGAYNKVDRHMPDSLWGGSGYTMAPESNGVDLRDLFYYDSRRQTLENYNLMLQNRQEHGKLEWGWMADYLHQDSKYCAERRRKTDSPVMNWEREHTLMREWSRYNSDKYNFQVDGGYKLSDNNMLDFQMNYSNEHMRLDGSNMDKVLQGDHQNSILAQMRDKYDQDIFNIQVQDSITLDKEETLIFTPSLRYNMSKITGYSNGKRFNEGTFKWLKQEEKQTDSKLTYQLALKKQFTNDFSMRMTGGTYYRLLNMSEIAGDGAGILPAPANMNGGSSVFPMPEEGKQFDLSGMWNNKFLGADNATTLTVFWRDSEKMLQLSRAGRDYWCYFNDNKGTAKGVELQTKLNWNKFDVDFQLTYLKTHMERMNSVAHTNYSQIWATYQPEWESNLRIAYRPDDAWELFTEAHYTDEYFTDYSKSSAGGEAAYLSGKPVSDLLVINGGFKYKPSKKWLLTFGCNDIFNEGPKMKIRANIANMNSGGKYINPEFPLQGRTYYATAKFEF